MSTTIQPGLEIRRLAWKDDIFKMATSSPPTADEWYDNTANNAITFANGTIETYGTLNLTPSTAITDGDALALPANIQVEKDLVVVVPYQALDTLRLRAKNAGSGNSNLTITLIDSLGNPISPFYTVTLASSLYTHYSIKLSVFTDVGGIQMKCDNGAVIDYVALATCEYVNQGGLSLNMTIPKRTSSLKIADNIDIIQQLGIASNTYLITIPKAPTSLYAWLMDKMSNNVPLEFVTPTQQATGYLHDIKRHTEAGWVATPLPSSDALQITASPQQLYDITATLVKTDIEVNTNTTIPSCVNTNPVFVNYSNLILTTDGLRANDSYQRHNWYMAGLYWAFYVDDTSGGNGFWYQTSADGLSWSNKTQITTSAIWNSSNAPQEINFGLWFDGTYLYYVTCDASGVPGQTANVYFRRGIPNSDSTITWSAAEQTITGLHANAAFSGVVWVFTDGFGHTWVMNGRGSSLAGSQPGLARTSHIDGTWSTDQTHYVGTNGRFGAVPLSNGNVVAFWTDNSSKHNFQTWNGTSWGTTKTGTGVDIDSVSFSAVAIGTQVHLTYQRTDNALIYMVYDSVSNSILSETQIGSITLSSGFNPPIVRGGSGNTVVLWADSTHFYAVERFNNGTFSSVVTQSYTRPSGIIGGRGIGGWDRFGNYCVYWFSDTHFNGIGFAYWSI